MKIPQETLAISKIIPDTGGRKYKAHTIAALANMLFQKISVKLGSENNCLPIIQLTTAPTENAASVDHAAATTP